MELKNIEKAKELIPQLEELKAARVMLAEGDARVIVACPKGESPLPSGMRLNILHVVNCEYERVRKEVEGL